MSLKGSLVSLMNENLGFEATDCQKNLFEKLAGFTVADSKDCFMMLVSGYAGTGKTSAISSYIKSLQHYGLKYKLCAPTGRSAKVLANYSNCKACTIHKMIYRQKSMNDAFGKFTLDYNRDKNTVYIVDECSLIQISQGTDQSNIFGSGDLLDDLVEYVGSESGNKLILMGDPAQLPPIGFDRSPALDLDFLRSRYNNVIDAHLSTVVRQQKESGILANATMLRNLIEDGGFGDISFNDGFEDIERIGGAELIEALSESIDNYGLDNVVVLCRSNNRANRYNAGIRQSVLFKEEQLVKGDKLMVVKNCYQFLENIPEMEFIANGDVAELVSVSGHEERYGLHFAQATLEFPDYDNASIKAKIILDTLTSVSPSLQPEEQKQLFEGVFADYQMEFGKNRRKIIKALKEDKYYNALQIKYAAAITCHKSQGGQWRCVFIDNSLWKDEISLDDMKWLYTAVTRAVEKVYFVNFKDKYFIKNH